MKTTIDLSNELFREAKQLARERGTTLRAVIESALRRELSARSGLPTKFRLRDASFVGEGVQAGVDLSLERRAPNDYRSRGG